MRINTNINSMRTQEYMRQNQEKMNTAMNRLSSGKSINSAADDAAGLAIATRMRAKEGGLNVASRNSQDGKSMIQTADSALNTVSNILLRMRDLAVQSANGTNDTSDHTALQKEFKELAGQIDYISANTSFNGTKLLNTATTVNIKSTDASGADTIDISLIAVTASTLGVSAADAIANKSNADSVIGTIDAAINSIADHRATLGATLNRLDYNIENLNNQATAMSASASQIEDADMAKEMSEMTKFKILSEAGVSMLSQANQTPQMVSKLLQ
ncbi:flagellin [Bacillus cytotoxicus]|uniref:flagellin N-terminal helical domain-containing protein n=1 Tax=unclassified Bacillus cereus group TaxID=2750818 RepID=UPI001F57C8CE|nr:MULTISPECIES: flagellin [unclassified Bacillus cereus group]EMA6341836.1 flagellin [Bacillus cytotoxicus]